MGGDIRLKSKPGLGSNFMAIFPSEVCSEPTVVSDSPIENALKRGFEGSSTVGIIIFA